MPRLTRAIMRADSDCLTKAGWHVGGLGHVVSSFWRGQRSIETDIFLEARAGDHRSSWAPGGDAGGTCVRVIKGHIICFYMYQVLSAKCDHDRIVNAASKLHDKQDRDIRTCCWYSYMAIVAREIRKQAGFKPAMLGCGLNLGNHCSTYSAIEYWRKPLYF